MGSATDKGWFLESIAADGSRLTQPIHTLPFVIGRDAACDHTVDARGLSRRHAEISSDDSGQLWLTDLGSTNGTFVNRDRITLKRQLAENDVVHFGNAEYRLGADGPARVPPSPGADQERTVIVPPGKTLSENFVRQERQFMELLGGRGLAAAAQPIVAADGGAVVAYELLGRCTHPELPTSPVHLFRLATMLDREAELSAVLREHGVAAIAARLRGAKLFINAHPAETFLPAFLASLRRLRSQPNAPELVVEVHESAVVDIASMRTLAAQLAGIGVPFAYDDFGAGQARLAELGDVPAHYVKFDIGLVHGIHEATERKQRVVRDLVRLVLDLGSVPLAEGVELDAEAAVCREMGFQLLQGFLTGRPVPVESL